LNKIIKFSYVCLSNFHIFIILMNYINKPKDKLIEYEHFLV
jgi:hypothetical protein